MTTVYVDTSALLKRVLPEPESEAVAVALRQHAERRDLLVSSSLAWVEVWRAMRRASTLQPGIVVGDLAEAAMAGIAELALSEEVLMAARTVGGDALRSLDAIHLASALAVSADLVVTFDDRLRVAAEAEGLGIEW